MRHRVPRDRTEERVETSDRGRQYIPNHDQESDIVQLPAGSSQQWSELSLPLPTRLAGQEKIRRTWTAAIASGREDQDIQLYRAGIHWAAELELNDKDNRKRGRTEKI